MKASLCLNVLDFCDVYLVANYCCETCHSHAANPVPYPTQATVGGSSAVTRSTNRNRNVNTKILPFIGRT